MQSFPHHYTVTAAGKGEDNIRVSAPNLPDLLTAAPPEFDGPGGLWSPETLLVAAVANCFILTFRAIARASNFAWSELRCEAVGRLDRVERVTQFTEIQLTVALTAPAGAEREKAQRLLEKAEQSCLISNSLKAQRILHIEVKEG